MKYFELIIIILISVVHPLLSQPFPESVVKQEKAIVWIKDGVNYQLNYGPQIKWPYLSISFTDNLKDNNPNGSKIFLRSEKLDISMKDELYQERTDFAFLSVQKAKSDIFMTHYYNYDELTVSYYNSTTLMPMFRDYSTKIMVTVLLDGSLVKRRINRYEEFITNTTRVAYTLMLPEEAKKYYNTSDIIFDENDPDDNTFTIVIAVDRAVVSNVKFYSVVGGLVAVLALLSIYCSCQYCDLGKGTKKKVVKMQHF